MKVRLEFTVEPFVEGNPGRHVNAAIKEARRQGLDPDIGPFATSVEGEGDAVIPAVSAITRAAFAAGASRVSMTVARPDRVGPPSPAPGRPRMVDRLIAEVQRELGANLDALDREAKQRAVKELQARGAFEIRGAAERVADALGVSRITVYNYLNKG